MHMQAMLNSLPYLHHSDEFVNEQLKQMREAAEEAKKWNEVPPKARPHRNRQESVQKYFMHEMAMLNLNQQKRAQNRSLIMNTFVTGSFVHKFHCFWHLVIG